MNRYLEKLASMKALQNLAGDASERMLRAKKTNNPVLQKAYENLQKKKAAKPLDVTAAGIKKTAGENIYLEKVAQLLEKEAVAAGLAGMAHKAYRTVGRVAKGGLGKGGTTAGGKATYSAAQKEGMKAGSKKFKEHAAWLSKNKGALAAGGAAGAITGAATS